MALALLLLGCFAVACVALTLWPLRFTGLVGPSFLVGWLTGELAQHWVVLLGCLAIGGAAMGGLHQTSGVLGLALLVVAEVGLVVLAVEGHRASRSVQEGLDAARGLGVLVADPRAVASCSIGRQALVIPVVPRAVLRTRNLDYVGDAKRAHRLDLYQPRHRPPGAGPMPILLYLHGGAWVVGDKREQGKPMLFELARRGWLCVSANYELSPRATWPTHVVDCKRAIDWVRTHAVELGGDPNCIVIAGGSAGGHLAALCALTPSDPSFQPGFEAADTSVRGCVSLYGVLEMTGDPSSSGAYSTELVGLLERLVIKQRLEEDRQIFEAASPVHRITASAPPFLVIQGRSDTMVPVATARQFVQRFRTATPAPLASVELPLAQHAFDTFPSPRTRAMVAGVVAFCEALHQGQDHCTGHA